MINLKEVYEIFLSGGNIYGVSYVGALKCISEYVDTHKQITRWIGTSSGGIIAFLMSIGYSVNILEKTCPYLPYCELNNFGLDDILNFFESFGLNDGQKLDYILHVFLKYRGFSKNITFKELYQATGKELALMTFCVSTRKSVLLDHENTPNLEIVRGVRMSSTIPYIFKPIKYDNKLYVDGFIADNTPADYVKYPDNCLGLNVYSNVVYNRGSEIDFFDFLRITYTSPMCEIDKYKFKNHEDRIMIIHASTNVEYFFEVNSNDIVELIDSAYKQMKQQIVIKQN